MMNDEEQFISGIHNYCDRWCERCNFSLRCRVGVEESQMTDAERDIDNKAFWRNLENIFAEAKSMLTDKAEELGIEIKPLNDEEYAEYRDREDAFVEEQLLTKLAEKYLKATVQTLESKNDWLILSPLDEEAQNEMLSIINWYQFFIAVKIRRGFQGLLDFDGTFLQEELDDAQSDANGSIKIAQIAVSRSLMAWTNLMSPENASIIHPLIVLLEKIRQAAEKEFPNAENFVRPGFDEIELVM